NNPGKVAVEELHAQAPRVTPRRPESSPGFQKVAAEELHTDKPTPRRGLSSLSYQSLGVAKLIPSIQSPCLGTRSSSLGMGTLKVHQPSPVFTKTHA
ncbi:hypothetical protein PIB30_100420, partial [Stylosanthes scabra]|nr:hypothetical protein [Stylosanthes scabra]